MTRLIILTSGKGGVGKTTLASNLAAALTDFGEKVIVMDANLTTPNLALQLGMHLVPHTLHDVLKGKSKLENAIYPHPYGFKVIPASLGLKDLKGVDIEKLPEISLHLLGKADYVIMDCSAGLGKEAISALSASDEALIVTTPHLSSITDALKIIKIAEECKVKVIGVVVNRVKGKKYELSKEEIEDFLGVPIIAQIPEDENVALSTAMKEPVIEYSPNSPASIEVKKLAAKLCGKKFRVIKPRNLIGRFIDWLRR